MKVQDLQKLTNEKIQFSVSSDSVVIRSWAYRYADMVRVSDIESVEMTSPTVVRISVPVGTMMGDHEILVGLNTGIVTADGKVFDEPMPEYAQKLPMQKKARGTFYPSINGFSIRSVKAMLFERIKTTAICSRELMEQFDINTVSSSHVETVVLMSKVTTPD